MSVPFPKLHRPVDILYSALAMPECDNFDGERGKSVYSGSFTGVKAERVSPQFSSTGTSSVEMGVSSKGSPFPTTESRAAFSGKATATVPPPRGWYSAQESERNRIDHQCFTATSVSRAEFQDTKPYLRSHSELGKPSGRSMHDSTLKIEKLPFSETSCSRASFGFLHQGGQSRHRRNPERERDEQVANRKMEDPTFFSMQKQHTTANGEFSGEADVFPKGRQQSSKVTVSSQNGRAKKSSDLPPAGKPLKRESSFKFNDGSKEKWGTESRTSHRAYTFM